MAVVGQGPPEPGGELAAHVVHGDDPGRVADPAPRHRLGEPAGGGDLGGHRVVRVDDVGGPVDEDGARDVAGEIFVLRPPVGRLLDAGFEGAGRHVASDVDHAEVGIVEVVLQPVGADQWVVGHVLTPWWVSGAGAFKISRARPIPKRIPASDDSDRVGSGSPPTSDLGTAADVSRSLRTR